MNQDDGDSSAPIKPPPIAEFDLYALWMNLGGKATDLDEVHTWTYERMAKVMMTLSWKNELDKERQKNSGIPGSNSVDNDPKFSKLAAYQKKVMGR